MCTSIYMICLNFIMSFSQTKNFTTICLVLSGKQVVLCVIITYNIILYVTCTSKYGKFIKSKQFNKRSQKKCGGRFYHYSLHSNLEERSSKLLICFPPPPPTIRRSLAAVCKDSEPRAHI
jgi:hypothetical protein